MQRQVVNRDKTIAPSATLLLYAAAFNVTLAVAWLVTAVAYAVLRRELSFTSRFSSFPCLLLPFVLCAHSTACGITRVFCRVRI